MGELGTPAGTVYFVESEEKIHAVLVLLAIRSLGKSKAVASQIAITERSPEHVVLHLIDEYQNVVPSVTRLSEEGIKYAKGALRLHSMFNLAQMLQGENVPANVGQLQESIKRDGVEALRFYILFLLGFMSGLNAGRGSKFLTAKRAESFIEGVRVLKYLLDTTPCGIYWGRLDADHLFRCRIRGTTEKHCFLHYVFIPATWPQYSCSET